MGFIKDLMRISKIKPLPRRPQDCIECDFDILKKLTWIFFYSGKSRADFPYTSETVPENIILKGVRQAANYINKGYDCSDFRICWLLKFVYSDKQKILCNSHNAAIYEEIKESVI